MEKMSIYNAGREVPAEAKKTIQAGRLKGFTDVNPMWRIKKLTELFGACGFGWYYKVTDKQIVSQDNETCVFVEIALFVKNDDGEWSQPIYGCGGSKILSQERSGPYVSDEAFKMAQTDALSVACKNLGIGADVYYEKDRTKYTRSEQESIEERKKAADKFAAASSKEKISKNHLLDLANKIAEFKLNIEYIKKTCKVDDLANISEKDYYTVVNNIELVKTKGDEWKEKEND